MLDFIDWDKSSIYAFEEGESGIESWNFTTRNELEENFISENKEKIGKLIKEWFLDKEEFFNLYFQILFNQNDELQTQLKLVQEKLKKWMKLVSSKGNSSGKESVNYNL